MALDLMSEAELKQIGISGQNDKDLDSKNGGFSKAGWYFKKTHISTDGLTFADEYEHDTHGNIFLVSTKAASALFPL